MPVAYVDVDIDWYRANPDISWDPDKPTPYRDFRTGVDFKEMRQGMKQPGPPPWPYRRRNSVLGAWWMMKQKAYKEYLEQLEQIREAQAVPF